MRCCVVAAIGLMPFAVAGAVKNSADRTAAADSLMRVESCFKSLRGGDRQLFRDLVERAIQGNTFANMVIGTCYKDGVGVAKDEPKAIPYLTAAAESGSLDACRELGLLLLKYNKTTEAARWLRIPAKNGDTSAMYHYGRLLVKGDGVAQDTKQGVTLIRESADRGLPQAMYYVGVCYMAGDGVPRDPAQAIKWYKRAAANGETNAMWALAECYRTGSGVPVNYDEALYRYAEATTGSPDRFGRLISDSIPSSPFVAYLNGLKAYRAHNFERAAKEFQNVENTKIADGKVMRGVLLADPTNPAYDMPRAIKLLKSAGRTHPQALYELAKICTSSSDVTPDAAAAMEYLTLAADQDYAPAQCELADRYYEGRGCKPDYSKAVKLYAKAAEAGRLTETSARNYADCLNNGRGTSPDPSRAAAVLKSVRTPDLDLLLGKK